VVIHVKDHNFFSREGKDLACKIPVSFVQAALGDSMDIPLLGEESVFKLDIPKGTQPGDVIRVPGKGMPDLRSSSRKGDLYVQADVKIPKKLNSRQKELLMEFAETEGLNPSKNKKKDKHIWEKLKK
jgi:molecular chaperone DnaJ